MDMAAFPKAADLASGNVPGAVPGVWRWRPGLGETEQALHSEIFASGREASGAGVALALALDQLRMREAGRQEERCVLWVQDAAAIRLTGRPYRPGLPASLHRRLIHVCAREPADALFALEEGVRCRDLACVIGEITGNAKALDFTASRRPEDAILAPGEDAEARLGDLPVAALRLDDDVLLVLKRLGLKRLGDISGIEGNPGGRDAIQRRFRNRRSPAANPLIRLDQLLGRVPEPLLPVVAVAAPLVQRRLMEPIRHRDPLDQVLRDLAADMARELEGRGEGARRLELGMWRVDGEVVVRRLELAAATRDAGHICRLFAARLDDVDAGFGIEMVRLRAAWAEPLGLTQTDLEAAAEEHGTSLAACIDRLTVRLGADAVRRPVPRASHIPERAQTWHKPLVAGALTPEPASQEELAFHTRPLKLLDSAEKIAVLYATPDGYPKQFRWRGQVHEVARVEGPERIAPEWWREKGSARLRDYYRIEDAAGRRYWIFRAGIAGDGRGGLPDWFLHGLCA